MTLAYREMQIVDLPSAFAVRLSTVENSITMEALEEEYGVTPQALSEAMKRRHHRRSRQARPWRSRILGVGACHVRVASEVGYFRQTAHGIR